MSSFHLPAPLNSDGWTTADWTTWLAGTGVIRSVCDGDAPTCARCRRPMGLDNYGHPWERCFDCNQTYRGTARAVVPICYSSSGQLTSVIAQAKDEPDRWWIRFGLAGLLYSFLTGHRQCLEARAFGAFDYATVVPSHPSKRGGRDHLKDMIGTVAGSTWPGIPWQLDLLTKTKPSIADDRRRSIDPDLFVVSPGHNVAGRRILLVDDLYTSGGTVASAATALTTAGADPPVVVTIGRQLDINEDVARDFAQEHLNGRRYEPTTCAVHTRPGPFATPL